MYQIVTRILSSLVFLAALSACGGGETYEAHLARANRFLADSDHDAAEIELKNALQINGSSAEARWLLGRLYLQSGDAISGEKELRLALQLGWSASDATPALARVLLAQGKYAEVSSLQERGLRPQAGASLLASKALAEMVEGDTEKARRLIDRALETAPESREALLARARILVSDGDLAGADRVVTGLVSDHPENGAAWILIGDIRASQRQLDEALVAYNRAVALHQDPFRSLFKRALLNLEMGDSAAAQADANELLRIAPHHPGTNYIQGVIHFRAENFAEAITSLSVAEPAVEHYPLALFFLAAAHLAEGNLNQAALQASRFHDIAPESLRGRKLLAAVRLQQGKYRDGRQPKEAAPDTASRHHLSAMTAAASQDWGHATRDLHRALELDEEFLPSRVALARIALAKGRSEEFEKHLRILQSRAPKSPDVLLLQAASSHRQGDANAAAVLAEQAFRQAPSTARLLELGAYLNAAGDRNATLQHYRSWIGENPGDVAVKMAMADQLQLDQKVDAAAVFYEQIVEDDPDNVAALNNLAWHVREEDPGKALQYARRASGLAPDSAEVLDTLAVVEYANGDYHRAQLSIQRALRQSPDNPSILYHSAMIAAARGNDAPAIDILEGLVDGSTDFPEIDQARALLLQLRQ